MLYVNLETLIKKKKCQYADVMYTVLLELPVKVILLKWCLVFRWLDNGQDDGNIARELTLTDASTFPGSR